MTATAAATPKKPLNSTEPAALLAEKVEMAAEEVAESEAEAETEEEEAESEEDAEEDAEEDSEEDSEEEVEEKAEVEAETEEEVTRVVGFAELSTAELFALVELALAEPEAGTVPEAAA